MKIQIKIDDDQRMSLLVSNRGELVRCYLKMREGKKVMTIDRKSVNIDFWGTRRLLAKTRIKWEKLDSLIRSLVFGSKIEEYEEWRLKPVGGCEMIIKDYPYLGNFLELTGSKKTVTEKLKTLGFNIDPELLKSIIYYKKLMSQDMNRVVNYFFAENIIFKSKLLKKIWNMTHHKFFYEDMFMFVNFEINWFCNRRCSYCPVSKSQRVTKKKMSLNTFRKVVEELGELNYDGYIHYNFYNETLLDYRLEKFLMLSKSCCPEAKNHINTNGDLLTIDKYKSLLEAGADWIFVTLHDGYLSKERKTFFKMAKRIKDVIDFELPQNMIFNNRGGLVDVGKSVSFSRPCLLPSFDIEITANGDVLPCCNDYFEKMKMGNVRNQSLKEIWMGGEFSQFRDDLKNGKRDKYEICRHCNI